MPIDETKFQFIWPYAHFHIKYVLVSTVFESESDIQKLLEIEGYRLIVKKNPPTSFRLFKFRVARGDNEIHNWQECNSEYVAFKLAIKHALDNYNADIKAKYRSLIEPTDLL